MWLFTTFGFFSIVDKEAGDVLTVRARVSEDLDRLRERYLPSLSATEAHTGTDYPYRARALRADVAEALRRVVEELRYPNFKDAVREELGLAREALCHEVWHVMHDAETAERPQKPRPPERKAAPAALRYGGVVVNERGEVLLFEPRNHHGGYAWTFPKGTPEAGETPEQTALREVEEEAGVTAEIVGRIPGVHRGTTSDTVYYLMTPKGRPRPPGEEAQAVRWVSMERAPGLIRQTTVDAGVERDLKVLALARELIGALRR